MVRTIRREEVWILHINDEDVRVTAEIVQAGRLLDVEVLDHLILGPDRYVSLHERGLGWEQLLPR